MLEQVDTLVVDKTGTLTEGKPALTTVDRGSTASTRAALLRPAPRASSAPASIRWRRRSSRGARASAALGARPP